jgi:3D (Asp-Asp-Asp) domain-containing protein
MDNQMKYPILVFLLCLIIFPINLDKVKPKDTGAAVNTNVSASPHFNEKLNRYKSILSDIIPEWDIDKPFFSKEVEITAYTSRIRETDSTPYITASNEIVRPGGIAISRDLLNIIGGYGTKVIIKGYGVFVVNDIMNARYTNSVDIWSGDLQLALKHGRQKGTIIWQ